MEDSDYYRASPKALDMSPHTEEGRANIRADNARIKAELDRADLMKPLFERGSPPQTFMECEEQADKLRDMFRYDPETGLIYRRYVQEGLKDHLATKHKGRESYGNIGFYGFTTSSANMVWLLHHGRWPIGRIKRRDNDSTNDRIENLYEPLPKNLTAIPFQGRRPRAKTSRGVARYGADRWQAYYRIDGKQFSLGKFKTEAEALAVRQAWERGDDLV